MTQKDPFSTYNFQTELSVRFRDVDAFGHVNNAVYFTYFEIARSEYWKQIIHWNWDEMGIIIARAEIDYVKPVLLNDEIFACVKTSRVGKSSFDLDYLLFKRSAAGQEICASGKTVCVSYDYTTGSSKAIPELYKQRMLDFEQPQLSQNLS